jgi:hypothetical protein
MNRFFKLRQDFMPAFKLQWEIDISASIIVPANQLEDLPDGASNHLSLKFAKNCEAALFLRPVDAIIRGYDQADRKRTSRAGQFVSNLRAAHTGPMPRTSLKTHSFYEYPSPAAEIHR